MPWLGGMEDTVASQGEGWDLGSALLSSQPPNPQASLQRNPTEKSNARGKAAYFTRRWAQAHRPCSACSGELRLSVPALLSSRSWSSFCGFPTKDPQIPILSQHQGPPAG